MKKITLITIIFLNSCIYSPWRDVYLLHVDTHKSELIESGVVEYGDTTPNYKSLTKYIINDIFFDLRITDRNNNMNFVVQSFSTNDDIEILVEEIVILFESSVVFSDRSEIYTPVEIKLTYYNEKNGYYWGAAVIQIENHGIEFENDKVYDVFISIKNTSNNKITEKVLKYSLKAEVLQGNYRMIY